MYEYQKVHSTNLVVLHDKLVYWNECRHYVERHVSWVAARPIYIKATSCVSLITKETEEAQQKQFTAPKEDEVEAILAAYKGVYAIAMYDYEAREDHEISNPNICGLYFKHPLTRANLKRCGEGHGRGCKSCPLNQACSNPWLFCGTTSRCPGALWLFLETPASHPL
ncbi:hypothetical protein VP01_2955g1 [Puccinia sorghi]|uniref:Uncharacterized protein n=1 Tax=Puccinia sorghi TaxID=27349 RepID=A0A0L6V102_9BASI|nr:hypothetical protein VP01_2955g1 [Puccinia sorghi]